MNKGVAIKRKACLLAALILLALPTALSAATGGDWGLMFDARNLLSLGSFEDGYQFGAGIKYWASPKIAVRALLGVDHNTAPDSGPSKTFIGLGLAGEWHPKRGDVSPYAGALAGFRMLAETDQTTAVDIYFGALFGAEAKLKGPISLFAEYDLIASFDINGFSVNLGTDGAGGGKALLGFIVYF
jgi:hypothetical protein